MKQTHSLYLLLLLNILSFATISAQKINSSFTKILFSDNFDEDNGTWKILSNADNLFLIQDGAYFLQRKNNKSPYSVFPKWENKETAFEISIRLKIINAEVSESGGGIIFMAQADGTGAFVFEINASKQYRLKQLIGVNFRLLSGNLKSNGWVDCPFLNGAGEMNQIQVKTTDRNYDIYINQSFIMSFTELAYKSGNIGISAGPATQFTVDQIYVYGTDIPDENTNLSDLKNQGSDDSLSILRNEIILLRNENKVLRDSLKILKKQKTNSPQKINPVKHPE